MTNVADYFLPGLCRNSRYLQSWLSVTKIADAAKPAFYYQIGLER